jgi:peptidyl-prolyl cis-trans isomerase SurA
MFAIFIPFYSLKLHPIFTETLKTMKKTLFTCISIISLYGCQTSKQPQTQNNIVQPASSPTMMTLGTSQVKTNEFKYVYAKNNANTPEAFTEKSLRDYLELYTNFRLKILAAEAEGKDTLSEFKSELEGYRKQLAQPYLTEKGVTEQLIKEAYERMKEEVSASHILLMLSPEAEPKDTLETYMKLIEYRKRALAGENFDSLASKYSQDPSAKQNFGKLGYFTSMQMVYQFEEAAFKTQVGNISMPIRTRFGYHILKVTGRRPSRGEVKVAHIMIRAAEGISKEDSLAAKQKADEIHSKLKSGEKWDDLCTQFSDDQNSKTKGGEMQAFSSNQLGVPAFEDAAFGLEKPGDFSKPIKTAYGWHIIKLIEKQPLKPFAELEPSLKTKVQRDSRSDLNKTIFIQKRKSEYKYAENAATLSSIIALADSNLTKGTFDYKSDNTSLKLTLFTLDGKPYNVNGFYEYVKANQKPKAGSTPSAIQRSNFKAYSDKAIMDYEESKLADKYEDYKMLYKEYRDGILLFSLMDEKVWTKAVNDTTGLKSYYEQNKTNYQWKKRNDAIVLNAADEVTLKKALNTLKSSNVYPVSDPSFDTLTFEVGKSNIEKTMQNPLNRVANGLKRDKNLIVKVTAYQDIKDQLNSKRLDSVMAYLGTKKVNSVQLQRDSKLVQDVTYIVTSSTKNKKPKSVVKKPNPLAGKIVFQVYSTSPKALEKTFNADKPLSLEIAASKFQVGENALLDSLEWKTGEFSYKKGNRFVYIISKELLEPTTKTLDEGRGQVISDYQNYLEKEWIKELRQKYPVTLNEEEFKKLVK